MLVSGGDAIKVWDVHFRCGFYLFCELCAPFPAWGPQFTVSLPFRYEIRSIVAMTIPDEVEVTIGGERLDRRRV